jgi:hypothetical protein
MKPRIRLIAGLWWCTGLTVQAFGLTPLAAYDQWWANCIAKFHA